LQEVTRLFTCLLSRPAHVLKGKFSNSLAAIHLRKGLVGFQFVISIGLVLATLVISQQMNYLQNRHLGFEQQEQLIIPLPTSESQKTYFTYKEEIKKNAGIISVTGSSTYPGRSEVLQSIALRSPGKSVQEAQDVKLGTVDYGFTQTLGFELLSGRFFSPDFPSDTSNAPTAIILNETAIQKLGYTAHSAIGKPLYFDWQGKTNTYQVVGVLKDFHFESLHEKIKPIGFVMQTRLTNPPAFLIARVHTQDLAQLLSTVENKWKVLNPGTPFEYSFLDQDFQRNYEAEQRTSQVVSYFTTIAILIACMGLYALTAYTAEQRTKEIGIRKVLGASASSIVALLSKDFLKLIVLANMIAWPLGWWAMNKWLEDFAYSVKINWWVFVLAGILAIAIAFLTISFQAIKAALANPIKSLRNE
jgi:putative ABC transport system permease protein